jgi:hypothetical protein
VSGVLEEHAAAIRYAREMMAGGALVKPVHHAVVALATEVERLEAENAALRADARLGALVRRLPELGSVPGSYERVGLCCEGQWSWKTERSNILSTAFSPSHETPDEALAAALGEGTP